jgi:hypothetical protein
MGLLLPDGGDAGADGKIRLKVSGKLKKVRAGVVPCPKEKTGGATTPTRTGRKVFVKRSNHGKTNY